MTSTVVSNWKNEDSIYHYRPGAFRDYIEVIANRDATVIEILQRARIREAKCLPKHLAELMIQELRYKPQLIKQVYHSLRIGMQPMAKLSLPYTTEERRQEILRELSLTRKERSRHKEIKKERKHAATGPIGSVLHVLRDVPSTIFKYSIGLFSISIVLYNISIPSFN